MSRATYNWGNDNAGRIIAEYPTGTAPTAFGYDAGGNVTSVTYPDGWKVGFQYDALNRPTKALEENGAGNTVGRVLADLHYDALSSVTDVIYGNGRAVFNNAAA